MNLNTKDKNVSALKKIVALQAGKGATFNKNLPAIEVINYTKKFGNFVSTQNINFKVKHGVIHGFIGPNGSGKTTTIKALIGAYIATNGEILINGFKAGTEKANALIGYIPERASFPKHLNSIDYLTSMAHISGVKYKVARERAMQILEALDLKSQAKRKPITFSSGMQKKILLAQSLLTDPSILILDEPAANLDPSARHELFDQLISLREQGKTIFISSHILAELERLVDEITFIYYGEMLYSGSVEEFNKRSHSVFIRTNDANKLTSFLKKYKYQYEGDLNNEIKILNINDEKSQILYRQLAQDNINIISFRSNDLQTSYEALATKANEKNRGLQMIKNKKIIHLKKPKILSKTKINKKDKE